MYARSLTANPSLLFQIRTQPLLHILSVRSYCPQLPNGWQLSLLTPFPATLTQTIHVTPFPATLTKTHPGCTPLSNFDFPISILALNSPLSANGCQLSSNSFPCHSYKNTPGVHTTFNLPNRGTVTPDCAAVPPCTKSSIFKSQLSTLRMPRTK
jgi:hypothetical protein